MTSHPQRCEIFRVELKDEYKKQNNALFFIGFFTGNLCMACIVIFGFWMGLLP